MTWQAELQASPSADLNRAESDQLTALQPSLQPFGLVVNLKFKLDLKERATNKRNKMRAGAKTGRGGCSEVASLGVSCYSQLEFPMLSTPALRNGFTEFLWGLKPPKCLNLCASVFLCHLLIRFDHFLKLTLKCAIEYLLSRDLV